MTEPIAGSFVVGTAGHIDHGKSTLVKALTQIDPDRLEEEKRRGIAFGLGVAYLQLPRRRRVPIVDVPGHQRFLKIVLGGVHGMDAVMLVVAADEGPMPQTREHLAIIDLLAIQHGLAVLTKADLVDPAWLGLVREEVAGLLRGTSLQRAPIVTVSGTTGEGLDELRAALDAELAQTQPRPDLGRPRLLVYHETAEVMVELSLLELDELRPGEEGWAQLFVDSPIVALDGDRFILRVPSPATTVAGGVIVDSAPRRHRRRDAVVLSDLGLRERADPGTAVVLELGKHAWGLSEPELGRRLGRSNLQLAYTLAPVADRGAIRRLASRWVTREQWDRLSSRVTTAMY